MPTPSLMKSRDTIQHLAEDVAQEDNVKGNYSKNGILTSVGSIYAHVYANQFVVVVVVVVFNNVR